MGVIDALISNYDRYNLLNSAILEMFEFIKIEDIKSLCTHVVENFATPLDKITYVQTFKALRMRYDQQQERLRDRSSLEPVNSILRGGAGAQTGRFRRDDRQLDEDEELWFNDEEDFDEEGSGPVLGPGGLGEPAKVSSCTSVSTTSPAGSGAAVATCQEKNSSTTEVPSLGKVMEEDKKKQVLGVGNGALTTETEAECKVVSSENGSATKKSTGSALGALVDYNDSDSDEDNGSSDEDLLPPSKRLKTGGGPGPGPEEAELSR